MAFQFGKKLAAIGIGFLTLTLITDSIDYVVYPLAVGLLGPLKGGSMMTGFWLVANYFLVWGYNKTERDWFGFEWLRVQQETESTTRWGKFLRFLLRRARWLFVAVLSWEDPFKAFVFVRGRMPAKHRFTAGYWRLFVGLNLLGNLIWIALISGVLEIIVRPVWQVISAL